LLGKTYVSPLSDYALETPKYGKMKYTKVEGKAPLFYSESFHILRVFRVSSEILD